MKNKENNRTIINIGTSLMVVILIGLAFAIIAALSVSSSAGNLSMARRLADHTKEYYQASNKAYEEIANSNWKNQEFSIDVNENQSLYVKVEDGKITRFQVENEGDWEADNSLNVITLED